MSIVVGIVGEKGAGKGEFAGHLQDFLGKRSISFVRFSDILRETLVLWGIASNRKNLQDLVVIMNDTYGKSTLSDAIRKKIEKNSSDLVVVDGVRWEEDLAMLRSIENNLLVYVTAEPEIRFKRLKGRGENEGESEMSFKQFLREEKAPNELLIPKIGKEADFVIENNSDMQAFLSCLEEFCKNFLK